LPYFFGRRNETYTVGYTFTHSIECPVSRDFAWRFWSNVENWPTVDPAVESVTLDGLFAAGTKGKTKPRGLAQTEWTLIEVQHGSSAAIEMSLPGAVLRFFWAFEETDSGGARLTQRVTLEGELVDDYRDGLKGLEEGIPAGMRNLKEAMERAAGSAA
jgi:hypothetical protein